MVKDEIFPIVNQVDARVQNFKIQFLKEADKFVQDFKSLANEADESLAKHKDLEFEIERLLRAVVSQDIMSIVQNPTVIETSDLQTELEHILDPLSQKPENENVELEFQVLNYATENAHLKTTYKNLFDSISVTRAQTKTIIDSLQDKLHDTIYENSKLRAQLFDKTSEQKDTTKVTHFAKSNGLPKIDESHALSKPITLNSVSIPQESKLVKNDHMIAPGMFRINPFKTFREEKSVPNKPIKTSVRTKPITISQPYVITKKDVNSYSNGLSSTGIDNTAKTRRPQLRSNTNNDRVPSASKSSCSKNKEVEVEVHPRNLLLSKNEKQMSSECNNIKLAIRNDKSKVVYAMCKQCLINSNHDVCVLNYVNDMNSRGKKQKANVSNTEENVSNIANQTKHKAQIWKPINVGHKERLALTKPSKPRMHLRWSPTGQKFDHKGKIIASSDSNGDNACTPNPQEPTIKRFPNSTFFLGRLSKYFLGTVRFGNDHVAAILGFGDLQWGNILITRVYFVKGLGHNLFSVGQFCDSNLEVAFRRNTCFIRNLEGVDLLKGNHTIILYTINLHDMASTSPICLIARATSTKSWLWHQRLSHLNFETLNYLARNDLVTSLPKFKYHKEHLCPSCKQGKSKRTSHPPKPVPNSKQRLHLLHMDLCGPMRIASINGKRLTAIATTQSVLQTQNFHHSQRLVNKHHNDLHKPTENRYLISTCFGALCYPNNDREDIRKLGAKGDIGFFIGYSVDSCAYKVYNRRTKKIMKTMNVTFDELSAMDYVHFST
ncbi:retrovirus-related pol polyprotein from transposon TNT 1-94 [Tanacetum coccineum]